MFSLILAAVCAVLYVRWRSRDRRMLRNGVVLVAGIWLAFSGVAELLTDLVPAFGFVWLILLALVPLAALVLAGFLIANGLTMLRREGRRLGNLLSLLLGVAVFALPIIAVALLMTDQAWAIGLAALLFVLSGYFGVVFVVFLAYAVAYSRMGVEAEPAAVVVLGSRLIDGTPPPLLKSRLDRALELYRDTEPRPLLVPSGGQGADEPRPEGAAMADYLVAAGADRGDVVAEERARTTEENLRYSLQVQAESGRPGPAVAVTNNYHVLRAALLARKLGIPAEVVGSPTAAYYVPSAFLREFVAVLVEHKWLHALLLLPFVAFVGFLVYAIAMTY
ncbi:YdcF family protein [Zhihengliuella alba]|uniref:YdcF family protein n=1 Tax=Zhihengliuella alba TaxID=547018 RepID=A0ABP7DNU0_9MICC